MTAESRIPTQSRAKADIGRARVDASSRIFVATDVVGDLELISDILRKEFEDVAGSADPAQLVAAFEKQPTQVLVLAFDQLEKAQSCCQDLYQRSQQLQATAHRTVILCNKDDVQRAYQLCKDGMFDDYVLFWPLNHDAPRLTMAVHLALRHIRAVGVTDAPTVGEFANEARQLVSGDESLEQAVQRGVEQVDKANRALDKAKVDIGKALDQFEQDLTKATLQGQDVQDRRGLQAAFDRFKKTQVMTRLDEVGSAVRPMWEWLNEVKAKSALQGNSTRKLGGMAKKIAPLILIVDDDQLQIKILRDLMRDTKLELICVRSGTEALAAINKRKPDLILMDVGLPDIDGVEVTRRIKSSDRFAAVTVIMITGRLDRDLVDRCLKIGAAGFVVKPFSKGTLLAKISSHLGPGAIVDEAT